MKYLLLITLIVLTGCEQEKIQLPKQEEKVIEYICASDGYWYAKTEGKIVKYGKDEDYLSCVDSKVQ